MQKQRISKMRKEKVLAGTKKSNELTRFGASIPARLLEEYDKLLAEMGLSGTAARVCVI